MATCLVIVESAAKAATIQKYLSSIYPDRKWTVAACFGHIRDLPQKTLGVDTNTWEVAYENLEKKKDVIAKLKKLSKTADLVYFAADPDLEGYAIAHHLRITLKLADSKCIRTTFNEITKTALKSAFDTPTGWNDTKVQAQETRRVLDRIVGYKVSPLLWKAFKGESGLSAGRVQSAALNMVIQRYNNFINHAPAISWTTHATFETISSLVLDTTEDPAVDIETLESAIKHVSDIVKYVGQHTTHSISFSERSRAKNPPAPFTTSTLQREAYTHLHKSPKTTMMLAQALYEGGFITYMRTDATTLSNDAVAALQLYILNSFGKEYINTSEITQQHNKKEKEGAHEAIRPTDVNRKGDSIDLTADHAALYDLIWKRTVASQMAAAIYNDVSYVVRHTNHNFIFKGMTSLLTFTGFMQVLGTGTTVDTDASASWKTIMQIKTVAMQTVSEICNVSRPHLLYTETDLVKGMEKNGIGRPSTYVSIIDKLQTKEYVKKGTGPSTAVKLTSVIWDDLSAKSPRLVENETVIGGTSKDRLVPSELGINIQKYLLENTPQLLDTTFTASMETNLDLIESGVRNRTDVLNEFYTPFQQVLAQAAGGSAPNNTSGAKHEEAFKKWIGIQEITDQDRQGLGRLPWKIEGGHTVLLGPYGIYTKSNGKNKKLNPTLWSKIIGGSLKKTDLAD